MNRGCTALFRSHYPHYVPSSIGLYVHIPFCRVKCPYCSFVVYVRRDHLREAYVSALIDEIRMRAESLDENSVAVPRDASGRFPVGTLYFGGGTPSLLDPDQLGALIQAARTAFSVAEDAEVTVETEPGTTTPASFEALRGLGVNRVTIGVQSFHEQHLSELGRAHSPDDARSAVRAARSAGIHSLDLDLMFGLPHQTLTQWQRDVDEALSLGPDHLSLYNLTVEPGTPYSQREKRGDLPLPEEELQAEMMRNAMARCREAGLPQYEISNFARPGHESRHNSGYWQGSAYLGVGVGAHGFLPAGGAGGWGSRSWNVRTPERLIEQVAAGRLPVEASEDLDRDAARLESLYLGLRQRRGLDRVSFGHRFGTDPFDTDPRIARLVSGGWLHIDARWARITEAGVIIADYLISELGASLDTPRRSDTVGA